MWQPRSPIGIRVDNEPTFSGGQACGDFGGGGGVDEGWSSGRGGRWGGSGKGGGGPGGSARDESSRICSCTSHSFSSCLLRSHPLWGFFQSFLKSFRACFPTLLQHLSQLLLCLLKVLHILSYLHMFQLISQLLRRFELSHITKLVVYESIIQAAAPFFIWGFIRWCWNQQFKGISCSKAFDSPA